MKFINDIFAFLAGVGEKSSFETLFKEGNYLRILLSLVVLLVIFLSVVILIVLTIA
tara:strand:- start:2863 stop:3030 length:168 start_codon:yes stop_codon:yes gene_type:complete